MRRLRNRFFLLLSILLLTWSPKLFCQYYTVGTDPASIKWMIIKTPHFKIIYPENFGEQSQYLANGMEYVFRPVTRSLESHPRRTPVIFHNRTTVANALTPYAPRRIEMFTSPSQDIYPEAWMDQLMLHEFRHSAQYGAIDRGFTRVLSWIFGEQAIPGMVGLFVPFWFIEGDAVVTETALSQTGRGRVPSFEMRLRAQFLQKKIYSYDKAVNGSYRDLIPDRYELGYQLVGMAREQYGSKLWDNALKNVGRYPFMTFPFAGSLRHQTGFDKRKLYLSLTSKLQEKWRMEDGRQRTEDRKKGTDSLGVLNPIKRKSYTSYKLPVIVGDSLLVAERTSLNDPTRIVLLDKQGHEKTLFTCGIGYQSESLSSHGTILYWSEQSQDPRWDLRDYRVIRSYDIRTGKFSQLTRRTRLYSPAVSPDGKQLVAVEVPENNHNALVIIDAATGTMLKKFTTPENLFFMHPSWSEDGGMIVSAALGKNGNTIEILDLSSGKTRDLIPFTHVEIKRPVFFHHSIIFTAAFTGADNLFAADLSTGKLVQLTHSRFGAADPFVDPHSGMLYYSDYSADGYNVTSLKADSTRWKPSHLPATSPFPLAETLTAQEHFVFHPDSVPRDSFPAKRYYKGLHLINLHSWAPLNVDVSNINITPGIMLMSQSLLISSTIQAGYSYNRNEEAGKYSLSWTCEGLYPAIDLSADYGLRRMNYRLEHGGTFQVKWHEMNLSAGIRIPLRWTHNRWYRGVQPGAGASWKNIDHDLYVNHGQVIDRNFFTLNYSFYTYNEIQATLRDIYPRWGQIASINFQNSPFNKFPSSIFAAQGYLYFPGILKHHGIRVYSGYQERKEDFYSFSDYISYPYGYADIYRLKVLSAGISYALPLFYPDWNIGPILYIKRFKTTLFYNQAWFLDKPATWISSTGLDLTADFHLLRHFIPIEAGVRSIYIHGIQQFKFQFIFSVNLNGL